MTTREDKRMIKLEFFSKVSLFGHTLKDSAHPFFGAWSFLLVHIRFTPSGGPKGFVNCTFKKSNHESWAIKSDHEKRPSFMVRFQVPWCKPALSSHV